MNILTVAFLFTFASAVIVSTSLSPIVRTKRDMIGNHRLLNNLTIRTAKQVQNKCKNVRLDRKNLQKIILNQVHALNADLFRSNFQSIKKMMENLPRSCIKHVKQYKIKSRFPKRLR
jgi:uncharacterized protein YjbI with pentapeptide repeats